MFILTGGSELADKSFEKEKEQRAIEDIEQNSSLNEEDSIDHRGSLNDFLSRYKNNESDITGILSRYQNMGVDLPKMASMVPTFTPPLIDSSIFTGILSRYQSLEMNLPKMASIIPNFIPPSIDLPDFTRILSRYQSLGMDLPKMASIVPNFIPPSIDMPDFTGILSRYQSLELDLPKMASIFSTLTSSQLDMASFKGISSSYENIVFQPNAENEKFGISDSLTAIDEMLNEIKGEMEVQEETNLSDYSDEQVQFILKSLEDWLEGSIGFKSTLKRIKGSTWASNLMYTLIISAAFHIVHILLIIDDYKFQQDRIVLESIQTHLETNVLTFKLVKNLMNQDKINTYHSMGFNRTDITLREGRSKTAPVVINGVIGQKTLVLMLERKNNWRKVEVKIKGTYLQGWVPESSITRLKK